MSSWATVSVLGLTLLMSSCVGLPAGTYYPEPRDPNTARVATTLYRAASAAGDDPTRYTFAFIRTRHPVVYTDEDATFYISDGLAAMPMPVLEGTIAQAVAHEVLRPGGTRRRMSAGMTGGFSIAGFFVPGVGMLDYMVNPLVVRACSRKQELDADRRAVEILRTLGDPTPRRTLAAAMLATDAAPVKSQESSGSLLDTRPTLPPRRRPTSAAPRAGRGAARAARARVRRRRRDHHRQAVRPRSDAEQVHFRRRRRRHRHGPQSPPAPPG